jgi:hypothetical protein
MRFANYLNLNEDYSKELSNALRKRGLAKKVGDLAADWNISITRSETHDVSGYVGSSPKPIKNVIANIRRDPYAYDIRIHGDGILLFVHTTDGITCCHINSKDIIPSSRDLDRYTKIGDVSGDVESCYFIKASSEDRRGYSGFTQKLRRDRRENKDFTDSTTAMAQERKYKMMKINIGRSISKNKLTNKIQTLLEDFNIIDSDLNAGSIFVTQRQRGDRTIYVLHGLNFCIKFDLENTTVYVRTEDSFDGLEEDCLDKEVKIEFSASADSNLERFETESDNLSDHLKAHETYIQLIKTLIKIRELLKGKTWGDLLI